MFKYFDAYVVHMRFNKDDKYACEYCGKSFLIQDLLVYAVDYRDKDIDQAGNDSYPDHTDYWCKQCLHQIYVEDKIKEIVEKEIVMTLPPEIITHWKNEGDSVKNGKICNCDLCRTIRLCISHASSLLLKQQIP